MRGDVYRGYTGSSCCLPVHATSAVEGDGVSLVRGRGEQEGHLVGEKGGWFARILVTRMYSTDLLVCLLGS